MSAEEYKQALERVRDPDRELRSQVRFVAWLLIVAAIFAFVFTQVLIGVRVFGDSMNPTLQGGDYLFVYTFDSPARGDIIVTREKEYDKDGKVISEYLIKRVVALPGDTIWAEDGVLYLCVAGSEGYYAVEEPYLNEEWTHDTEIAPITVSEGHVFVLGDNRNHSLDSRDLGELPLSDMLGVVTGWSMQIKGFLTAFFGFFS